jgi:hypothetical protein
MTPNEVIDAWVSDVARRLPRRQRNDVAFELRALLHEELQDKADAAGHPADEAMATGLVRAFGDPKDVAARYRPTLTIIEPSDGRTFLRATVIGLLVIWSAGLLEHFAQPMASGGDFLGALGRWWVGTVVASLWWPGALVLGFGLGTWARRRRNKVSGWKPQPANRLEGGRAGSVMALLGITAGLAALAFPHRLLDLAFGGRAAPAAYEAFTYTDTFLQLQAPVLAVLLALNLPLIATAMVRGQWSPLLRRLDKALWLATCAVLTWIVLDGPVFKVAASDGMVKLAMAATVLYVLVEAIVKWQRQIRPAPGQPSN